MPEFRQDPISGRWVIIAPQRAARPNDFEANPGQHTEARADCPFCAGHEAQTPPEVHARRPPGGAADTPDWSVRAVPNKFPALVAETVPPPVADSLSRAKPGSGAHEVIIESPRHVVSLTQLTTAEVAEAVLVYAERLKTLGQDRQLKYGLVFKNVGAAAGASLEHTHAQLLATPFVPAGVQQELDGAAEHYHRHGRCPFCAMLEAELASNRRIVVSDPQFVAFCPHASRFAFETWIVPRAHAGRFERIDLCAASALATVLRRVLAAVERVVSPPAYNLLIHTLPFDMPEVPHYHWHVEVLPSLTKIAGFEWGTGVHINAVAPEEAAVKFSDQ